MKYKSRRNPPALRRAGSGFAAIDRDDPNQFAKRVAKLILGQMKASLPNLPSEMDVMADDPNARAKAFDAVGDVSYLFPDEEGLAAIRSVKPDYQVPTREERARNFLSDYLLCASLLESYELTERISARISADHPSLPGEAKAIGNADYWRSRCRSVSALIASLAPSREKLLLTLRYLRGLPIERAAERMAVSRRTAYRIHAHALTLVGRALEQKRKEVK